MRGGGLLRVLAVTCAGAALVAGAGLTDERWIVDGAPRQTAGEEPGRSVPVASRALGCPGPETVGVAGLPPSGQGPVEIRAAGAPAGVPGAVQTQRPDGVVVATALPGGGELAREGAGRTLAATVPGPTSVAVRATGRPAPTLTAVQRSLVTQGERAALVSTPCTEPLTEAWLLAGSGQAGRQEHLVLTNPGGSAVTVDVTLQGAQGPVSGVAGQGVVVQPHARTVVLLDALDGSEVSPAAHVVARGGAVQAVLRDTWLDGITSRGADDVVASPAPARRPVVAGLAVAGEADPAVVRVAVPEGQDADVRLQVLGAQGPVGPATPARRVRGGSSVDVGLPGLPAGVYAVQVEASAPVVAAGYVGRADGPRPSGPGSVGAPVHDLAWVAAGAPLTDLAGSPLGWSQEGRPTHRLAVTNPSAREAAATVTLVGQDGRPAPRPLRVPPRASAVVDLGEAASVWLSPSGGELRAAVVGEAEGGLVTVTPLAARSQTGVPQVVTPQE